MEIATPQTQRQRIFYWAVSFAVYFVGWIIDYGVVRPHLAAIRAVSKNSQKWCNLGAADGDFRSLS
jgi:hypothetical protein